jgi:transposase
MKELLSTKSIPKNREEKTSRLLEALKQNINEAKRSQEASALDPNSIIMSEKRKMDEQNLRLTLTKTKEWLNSLVEYQRLESRSLRYAAVASALAVLISVGGTYGFPSFILLIHGSLATIPGELVLLYP